MYTITRTKKFEKSFAKLKDSGTLKESARAELFYVIDLLASGVEKLPQKYRDHGLVADFYGYRECHIKDNLLLVYKIEDEELLLVLFNIGTHVYLFGD